jgi:predicted nucleic acid-binding protein
MKQKGSHKEKVIIDSFGWVEYYTNGKLADKYAKYINGSDPDTCLTPSIIIYEVYKIIRRLKSEEEAIIAIVHIDHYSTIVNLDIKTATLGADSSLEQGLGMADAIIWGIAQQHGAKIITSDKDFKGKDNVIFIE